MINNSLNKLKKAKTKIRKTLQRKNTEVTLDTYFIDYYECICNMSNDKNPDVTNLRNYVEDRLSYIEINVNKIRPFAFRYFTCLKGIYLNNSNIVQLDDINAFYEIKPIIFVPENLYEQYIIDPNWIKIKDRIKIYNPQEVKEFYLLEYIDYIHTIDWIQEKTIEQFS